MRITKFLVICSIILAIYGIATYIYFSAAPAFKYYCPIQLPNQAPLELHDPAHPEHTFKTINDASCLNETRVHDII